MTGSQEISRPKWHQSMYDQLHQLAGRELKKEAPGHSLQPTVLVNDAFMKLLEQRNVDLNDRTHAMAVGANILRRLLVDHARKRKTLKRGGQQGRGQALFPSITTGTSRVDVVELHDALEVMEESHSRPAKIVELKFFGGLTGEEISSELNVSRSTVQAELGFAKAWLKKELSEEIE
ncbi:RNA polymerase sigma factor [Thalassoglobus neptunius]|uniref:RNA polymerase sigma factor n=1 Tax=Thalassoglobus neptunius TaxID=1938619 RepID=A0A5C5X5R8_9PLAN|nr:ECF-type sigma factor [Thalassoglobus neptunius]TWT58280.1 RNA polymerase sigma factor [Thalassoglobus neptunius]